MRPIRVTIWNEYRHERTRNDVAQVYPQGIHRALAAGLGPLLGSSAQITTAVLDDPHQGLPREILEQTDVLIWWGHGAHHEVSDELVQQVLHRVWSGMGFIALHSAHACKVFQRLMGTGCMLRWREAGELERLWVVAPGHPLTEGLGREYIELPKTEMYGEYFDVPPPDELIFVSWFEGGEVFRSGCTWQRGSGKIFYFRPGHETYPIYYDPMVLRVIANAIVWARPIDSPYSINARQIHGPMVRSTKP